MRKAKMDSEFDTEFNSAYNMEFRPKSNMKYKIAGGIVIVIALLCCVSISVLYGMSTIETVNVEEKISFDSLEYVYAQTAEKVIPSSVIIEAGPSRGSGVVVGDGLILTNDHVVGESSTAIVTILDENGRYCKYRGNVIAEPDGGRYSKIDLALIQIEDQDFASPAIKLGNMDSVEFGTSALMVGNPRNVGLLVTKALVSNPCVSVEHPKSSVFDFIAIDAGVNSGNSGGGLYNVRGELIGIVTLRQVSDENNNADASFGIGFAIRIDDVSAYLGRYTQFSF